MRCGLVSWFGGGHRSIFSVTVETSRAAGRGTIEGLAARRDWARCAQEKLVALNPNRAQLGLADPVRIQRNKHRVGEVLLFFIDVEGTGIGDVAGGILLRFAL